MRSFWRSHFLTLALAALDVFAFSLIWKASHDLRVALNVRFPAQINAYQPYYSHALPVLLGLWLVVLIAFKQYAHHGKISSINQAGDIIKSGVAFLILALAAANVTKSLFSLGSSVIGIAAACATIYLYLCRTALRMVKESLRQRGIGLVRTAIIGAGQTGQSVALRIKNHPEVGYELAGFIDRDAAALGAEVAGIPVIGDCSELVTLLLRYRIEEVFLAVPHMPQDEAFELVVQCEEANVHFKIVRDDLLQVITDRVKIDDIGDLPVIPLREGRISPAGLFVKRALDLILTVPMLALSTPLWAFAALMIKRDSPGPVLFSHNRVGMGGRVFRLHKFRTMKMDAEPYAPAPGDQGDPRITRFGRWLRKTSLDELPQFLNVLKGDMSLVGPRPEMPFIVAQYEPWQRRRLDVPQGLTGLWQIAGRKQLPLHFNLEYDFYYIRNWTLLLDLVILLRTIPAVFLGRGAF